MSNMSLVWNHLQKFGEITNKKIEKLTGTTCPHDIIRKIRNKYGAGVLDYEDIYKKEKRMIKGKEVIQSRWFRRYFLNKMEGT